MKQPSVRNRFAALFVLFAASAFAQSPGLLESVQLDRSDALSRAKDELATCVKAKCAALDRLALLTGVLELSSGDAAAALATLPLRLSSPLAVFDAYYRGEALFYLKRYGEAAAAFTSAQSGPSWLSHRAVARQAESLWQAGDATGALPLFDRAIADQSAPELLSERAQVRRQLGDLAGAQKDWLELAVHQPATPEAQAALAELAPGAIGEDDALTRADGLVSAGAFKDAISALGAIDPADPKAKAQKALLLAQALYGVGKNDDAGKAVQAAQAGPPELASQALLLEAKRLLKGDDHTRALAAFARLSAKFSSTPAAEEADYLKAWIELQDHALKLSAHDFAAFVRKHPHARKRDDAMWFLGLTEIEAHQYPAARHALQELARRYPDSSLVPQAIYWSARCQQLSKDVKGAKAGYADVVTRFPGTFYAHLAVARLHALKVEAPAGFEKLPAIAPAAVPPSLGLADSLRQAGLFRDFAEEVQAQVAHASGDAGALGSALQSLGAYGAAYRVAARSLWKNAYGQKDPLALTLLYPRAFEGSVTKWATDHGIDPAWIWAIMRRESAYRPDLTSLADARGLMQLLPVTAAAIAKEINVAAPEPEGLYSPDLSVELASWYLAQLVKQYRHPVLAAAAYNAGPPAVAKWIHQNGKLPLDLFVEEMPFKETRGYVKQVTADILNYHALYGGPSEDLPLEVPEVTVDDVKF
jgi:soluble lytic murein transglycosylase